MYTWEEILSWFSEEGIPEPTEIIYAEYDNGGYDGQAWVLFYDNGKFYYVGGSHCSCYDLSGQWSPEEYSVEALKGQVERANYGFFKDQKGLIMKSLEKFTSPIAQSAAEYAQVETELAKAVNDKKDAEERIEYLTPRLEALRLQIKNLL